MIAKEEHSWLDTNIIVRLLQTCILIDTISQLLCLVCDSIKLWTCGQMYNHTFSCETGLT